VDIRHAGVTTDSRDDVVVTDRSVWCMDEDYDLLCVSLVVNQSILLFNTDSKSDVRPLLFRLIDEECYVVRDTPERVRMLLEAGADVNVRVNDRENDSVLDREGVCALERTMRRVCQYRDSDSKYDREYRAPEYKKVMSEVKKYVRRYSV
jgi:hypothetical protein